MGARSSKSTDGSGARALTRIPDPPGRSTTAPTAIAARRSSGDRPPAAPRPPYRARRRHGGLLTGALRTESRTATARLQAVRSGSHVAVPDRGGQAAAARDGVGRGLGDDALGTRAHERRGDNTDRSTGRAHVVEPSL